MPEWLPWLSLALAALTLLLVLWLLLRRADQGELLQSLRDHNERLERELRTEVQDSARGTRRS